MEGQHIIETDRFYLRHLEQEDATPKYLSWLKDPGVSRFICTATQSQKLEDLRKYIGEKTSENSLFWGIFERSNLEHIGNIKYEPIDRVNRSATMGILIGEATWHGKGVAGEVIPATAHYLQKLLALKSIRLGVDAQNTAAIRAYEKIGFKKVASSHPGIHTMDWEL
jgi:[ribosomal protein S5]-alanine N-acetyltransferase